jgi:hypothetical protein
MRAEADLVGRAQSGELQVLDSLIFEMAGIDQKRLMESMSPDLIDEQRRAEKEQRERALMELKEAPFNPRNYDQEILKGFPGAQAARDLKKIKNGLGWASKEGFRGIGVAQRKGNLAIDDQGRVTAGDPFWAGVYAFAFANGEQL